MERHTGSLSVLKTGGILVILLFLLTACSGITVAEPGGYQPSGRAFIADSASPLILSDESPSEILGQLKQNYPAVTVDLLSEHSLFATVHAQKNFYITVVPNDLDGTEAYLVLITYP